MKRILSTLLALLACSTLSHTPPAPRVLAWTYFNPVDESTVYEIWRSTDLAQAFTLWAHTTNTFFPLPFNLPREFFRVRVVTPSGTSDWATVQ